MKNREYGLTLVELILAMLIFSVVMSLISLSFSRIVRSSSLLVKSAETDIAGLIGLELLRRDAEAAGFGLPWALPDAVDYNEVSSGLVLPDCPCPQAAANLYNDGTSGNPLPPSAYRLGNNVGYNGSDYLVLKGSALGMNNASQSWGYLNYSSSGAVIKPGRNQPELSRHSDDRVIVLDNGIAAGAAGRKLVTNGSSFTLSLKNAESIPDAFAPRDKADNYLVYGVASAKNGKALDFPFNRADYYISRPADISSNCAKGTGVLYKATINHNVAPTRYPVLECVADMQVVLFLAQGDDQSAGSHTDHLDLTGGDLREWLKEVRIYILAQQGKVDPDYSYPVTDQDKAISVGEPSTFGRVWKGSELSATFGENWRNYRWKIYTILVQPKNL